MKLKFNLHGGFPSPRSITLSYRRMFLLLSNSKPKTTTNHTLIFPIKHRMSITYPGQLNPTFGQSGVAQRPRPPDFPLVVLHTK
jgi:hypothetical protein